jgi:LysR family pca operon transcriptional activator
MIEAGIKVRHLRCFREVLRFGNFKAAADVLSISQPAVSKTISDLETMLGVRLLNRSRKGITPTKYGTQFSEHVENALLSLNRCVESVGTTRDTKQQLIRIGILPAAGGRLIPEAVQLYAKENKNHDLRIISAPTPDLIERLRLGELDFVVGHLSDPARMMGLNFEYLYSERIAFVVRPKHRFLRQRPFDMKRLNECTVLMPAPEAIIFSDVERFLLSKGIAQITSKIESASNLFGRSFTRTTDAVWITSEGGVAADLAEGFLCRLDLDAPETPAAVGITTRALSSLTAPVKEFAEVLRNVVRDVYGAPRSN